MILHKQVSVFILFALFCITSKAQLLIDTCNTDEQEIKLNPLKVNPNSKKNNDPFRANSLFIPGFMIAYGFASIEVEGLENLNAEIKDEIYAEEPHKKISIDNYLQFAPAIAVYGLNAMGIKGRHNFRDRSIIYLMSNILLTTSVYSIKKISRELRPDTSGYTSFPSGHTAEAFASAEFFRQEYKDLSLSFSYAGYVVAALTGYLRMYNNKHWLGDIVAGAGIGIATTKIAYWLYPKIQYKLFKYKKLNTVVIPSYNNKTFGLVMSYKF